MRNPFKRLAASVIILALGLLVPLAVQRSGAQGNNLLQNPGFEGNYEPFANDVTRLVAPGWSAWNIPRKPGEPSWAHITPKYLPASNAARIHGGQRAQEFFEVYATFTAGVFQRVSTTPGTPLRFSAFVNIWTTNGDDANESDVNIPVSVQVGIDPTGGSDGENPAIIWSSAERFYDEYRRVSVDATATGSAITVFVRAIMDEPVRHNNVYVDDASLEVIGGGVTPTNTQTATGTSAPPSDTPGGPPSPTREGATLTPSRTLPPGVTPSPTSTLPPGITPSATIPPPASPTPDDLSDLPGRIQYTVQSGDTVSGIAVRYSSRVSAIIRLNNLDESGFILIGQQLIIPVPVVPTATLPPFPTPTPIGTAPVDTAILNGPTVNGIGTYIMQPGDTLEAVARRYQVTVQYLARLNGIVNPNRLVIGQRLLVPGPGNNPPGGTSAPTIIPTQPGGGTGGPRTHVVQKGENLFRISLRYNVTLQSLMLANGIYNPNLIYVGQVLRIP